MASRNSERAVYHVTPDASAEQWIVSLENSNFRQEFETKRAAEKFAKEAAQNNGLAKLKFTEKMETWTMNLPMARIQETFPVDTRRKKQKKSEVPFCSFGS